MIMQYLERKAAGPIINKKMVVISSCARFLTPT